VTKLRTPNFLLKGAWSTRTIIENLIHKLGGGPKQYLKKTNGEALVFFSSDPESESVVNELGHC